MFSSRTMLFLSVRAYMLISKVFGLLLIRHRVQYCQQNDNRNNDS